MKIRFSPSGTLPGFVIEAENESDSGILEMVGRLHEEGHDLTIASTSLVSGARIRYPDIKIALHKRNRKADEAGS